MPGIARLAVILSISRIANIGLMIISPVILVRFLTVGDFGRYREFLLYATILQSVATFAIPDSQLYFIPAHPASTWRVVRETNFLTAVVSTLVIGGFLLLNVAMSGGLVGPYLLPVVLYVVLFVNIDFWEPFWLASHRPLPVFVYTAGRLTARMLVVVCAAVLTTDVTTIIWSLIGLESLRVTVSALMWRKLDKSSQEPPLAHIRRDQLRFCIPMGLATLLYLASRNVGNVAVAKSLGAVALAQLTIGSYGEPILLAVRNSLSTALLPELVRRSTESREESLLLWKRTTVVNCVLMFPAAVILAWYAEPLIVKVFGASYRPAIPILQIYGFVMVRACFDFSLLLRAINRTRPVVTGNLAAAIAAGLGLVFLLPVAGVVGAIISIVISNFVEAAYLGWSVCRLYKVSAAQIVPWGAVAKVALCALAAAAVVFGASRGLRVGLFGVMIGSAVYLVAFVALLLATGVQEAAAVIRRVLGAMAIAIPIGRS
jgi:O-antigen/teichoic acid export membrane protein